MTETTAAAPAVVPASRWWTADPVRPRAAAALLAVFGLLAIVELACAAAGSRLGEVLTKPLLMPVLAGCVLATAGLRRPAGLAVSGLLFGGVGDAALLGDGGWFLLGMAAFALGHLCYLAAFLRLGAAARLRERWWIAPCYLAVWAGLMVLLWPGLADLRLPVLGYSLLLTAMAASAAGAGRAALAGGVLFLVSDGLLALGLADIDVIPGRGGVVMPTYLAAQVLIALSLTRAAGGTRVAGGTRAAVAA